MFAKFGRVFVLGVFFFLGGGGEKTLSLGSKRASKQM